MSMEAGRTGTFSGCLAAAAGVISWLTVMVVGVKGNVVGVVFYDLADYPYEDAWAIASVMLAVGLASSTW